MTSTGSAQSFAVAAVDSDAIGVGTESPDTVAGTGESTTKSFKLVVAVAFDAIGDAT